MGVFRGGTGGGEGGRGGGHQLAIKPPKKKNLHGKMLRVAARHHDTVVFITRQQWKNVNDTIAD